MLIYGIIIIISNIKGGVQMDLTKASILDEMVREILGKIDFNPETDDLASLYSILKKELPN